MNQEVADAITLLMSVPVKGFGEMNGANTIKALMLTALEIICTHTNTQIELDHAVEKYNSITPSDLGELLYSFAAKSKHVFLKDSALN